RITAVTRPSPAEHIVARAGRAELGEDPFPVNRLEIDLVVGSADLEDKIDRLHAQLDALPGVNVAIEGFLGERVHEILGGETAPIAIDVIGPELEQLRSRSAAIADQIRGLAGVRSVTVEAQVDVAELRVRPDPVALAPYGLLPADVVEQVRTWRL